MRSPSLLSDLDTVFGSGWTTDCDCRCQSKAEISIGFLVRSTHLGILLGSFSRRTSQSASMVHDLRILLSFSGSKT